MLIDIRQLARSVRTLFVHMRGRGRDRDRGNGWILDQTRIDLIARDATAQVQEALPAVDTVATRSPGTQQHHAVRARSLGSSAVVVFCKRASAPKLVGFHLFSEAFSLPTVEGLVVDKRGCPFGNVGAGHGRQIEVVGGQVCEWRKGMGVDCGCRFDALELQ